MTLEQHNRTLGILHYVYGVLHALLMLLILGFMLFIFSAAGGEPNAPPAAFFVFFALFGGIFALLYTVPSFVAGYALLNRKPWARVAGIIAAVIETLNVPFGTALGVYALWFLFGDGARLYEPGYATRPGERYSLGSAPPPPADEFITRDPRERERPYVPPAQPPDWRG